MNKHIITYTFIMTSFFGGALMAQAQSYSVSAPAMTSPAITAIPARDLSVGSSGDDVARLQSWLISNGYSIPAISAGGAMGYFGTQTQAALAAYQRSAGLPAYGYYGNLTRSHINSGGYNSGGGSIYGSQVTSPRGGEVWQTGTMQNITWTVPAQIYNGYTIVSPYQAPTYADVRLEFPTPACAQPGQPIRCMIAVRAPYLIAKAVPLSPGSYSWRVGYVTDFSGSNASIAADGQYKVQLCPTDGSSCFESADMFTVTSTGNGSGGSGGYGAPVISGIDAPTSLSVGQTGTWSIHAYDPSNGNLTYSIIWGDEAYPTSLNGAAGSAAPVYQTSTFTHVYANPGTYTVRITVRNSYGLIAQSSATVNISYYNGSGGGSGGAGPLSITSPNGGQTWYKGTIQTITWTSPYYFRATSADLKLVRYGSPCVDQTRPCPLMALAPYTIATNIPINQNSYSWNVGSVYYPNGNGGIGDIQTIPDGQYTVQICESGTSNCDSSDAPFTIASSNSGSGAVPDVNITSPNGGEYWPLGGTGAVSVNVTGDASRVGHTLNVYLVDASSRQTFMAAETISGPGVQSFQIPLSYGISPGSYRVYVTLVNGNTMQAYDYSDGMFTVFVPYTSTGPSTASPVYGCPAGYICTPN